MYRYAPASETSYGYPFYPSPYHRAVPSTFTRRERSLAEAEYLAAQAAREEEEAILRRRLAEIQLARQQEEDLYLPPRRHGLDSYQYPSRYATARPTARDSSDLHPQIEEEIRAREALLHEPQVSRRTAFVKPEAVFPQVHIRRACPQPHPQRRCAPNLGPNNLQSLFQQHPGSGKGQTRCPEGSSIGTVPIGDASLGPFNDFFTSLLSAGVVGNKPTTTPTPSTSQPATSQQSEDPKVQSGTKAAEPSNDADALLKEFYNALSGGLNRPAPAASAPSTSTAGPSCQSRSSRCGPKKPGQEGKATHRTCMTSNGTNPTQPNQVVIDINSLSDWGQLLTNILGGQNAETPKKQEQANAQSSPSKTRTSQDEPKCRASPKVVSSQPAKAEATLKEELEARLNNEYQAEVRDTIQALLASLVDPGSSPVSSKPAPPSTTSAVAPSTPSETSKKGKNKAEEERLKSSDSSQDVSRALKLVTNIETSFRTLQSDFTFPSGLDFEDDTPSTPVSTASESRSATSILAFTSRNHPVRFYEQALGALLAKLDAIESHGSDELRSRRKEVVDGVEKALEELETEVEGRYRARLARDERQKHDSQSNTSPPIDLLKISTDSASVSQDIPSVGEAEVEDSEHDPANDDLRPGEVVLGESVVSLSSPVSTISHVDVADEPMVQDESTAAPLTEPGSAIPPSDGMDVQSLPSSPVVGDISAVIGQSGATVPVVPPPIPPITESSGDSTATLRPGPAESDSKSFDDSESTEGFLLEESMDSPTEKGRPSYKDEDTDLSSEWSDIEGH